MKTSLRKFGLGASARVPDIWAPQWVPGPSVHTLQLVSKQSTPLHTFNVMDW